MQKFVASSIAALMISGQVLGPVVASAQSSNTATPIKHLVVIYQENVSFDHYFGTYPYATNPAGEPKFTAAPGTPNVNGFTDALLHRNPNFVNTALNGASASNPFRLDRSEAATNDQDHNYGPEQQAFDNGLMDGFPKYTGVPGPPPAGVSTSALVMGYYDGNTVTSFWNYAQNYSMNDNSFGTTFGPSTPGAINLVSGQTGGVVDSINPGSAVVADGYGGFTDVNDADPIGDVCSSTTQAFRLGGQNIGDLLNSKNVTWGFFEGGFDLSIVNSDGSTGCKRTTTSAVTHSKKADYIPHHQPFQYYASTANLTHARPTNVKTIGYGDAANHQYDMTDFYNAVSANNFPAVSFLKAPGYQDGHAGYSDPLDEQTFVTHVINFLQQQPDWKNTAVIIAYDDSDGWYDHQMGPIVNQSHSAQDRLTGFQACGSDENALPGINGQAHIHGRCGYGPRLPFIVVSPYAKQNYVDHTVTDQSSITRFIEDNWIGGQRIEGSFDALAGTINGMFDFTSTPRTAPILLDESTGVVKQ